MKSQTASRLATIPRIIFDFLKSESDLILEKITLLSSSLTSSTSSFYDDGDTLSTISFLLHTYLFENLNIHPNAKKEFTNASNIQQTLQDNLLVLTQFIVCELHCRIGSKISESLFSVNNNNNNTGSSLGSNFLQFRSTIAFMARKEFFERANNQNIQESEPERAKIVDDNQQDYEIHHEFCDEEDDDDVQIENTLFCDTDTPQVKDDEDSSSDRIVLPCSPLADTMRVITPEEVIFALMLNNTSNSSNLNGESFQSSLLVFEEIVAECLYSQILVHRVAYSSAASSISKMKNILFLLEPLLIQKSMTKEQLRHQKEAMQSSRNSNGRTASISPPSSLSSSTFSSSSIELLLSKRNITRAEFFDNSMLSSPGVIFPVSSFSRRLVSHLISECAKTTTVASLLPHYQQRRKNFNNNNNNNSDSVLFTKKSQLHGEKIYHEFLHHAAEHNINSEVIRDDDDDDAQRCAFRPQLGVPFMDSIFSFSPGTVNEIYGEAGCGKSTWAAQLLMHTVAKHVSAIMMSTSETVGGEGEEFTVDENHDDHDDDVVVKAESKSRLHRQQSNSRDIRVLYLCAEPPSMERINQIAEHEAMKILKAISDGGQQEETKPLIVDALISRLLLLNVMSVEHFESTVRDLTSINNNYCRAMRDHDIPLIILDSVAALIEKSLDDNTRLYDEDSASSNNNNKTNHNNNSSRTENIRQAMKRQELIERVGTSLSELTKIRNFYESSSTSSPPTIIVINQARSASFSNSTTSQESFSKVSSNQSRPSFLVNKLMMNSNTLIGSSSSSATTTSLPPRPALGYSWSTFISGMSIELTKCLQPMTMMTMARGSEGGTVRQKRRARMMKNSRGKIYERRVDYEIVASGIQENSL